jgi:arginyl-tRNA synthetase
MATLVSEIEARLRDAVAAAVGPEHRSADPQLRRAAQPKLGDFQANLAMGLAKRLGVAPRALAQSIVDALDAPGLLARAEVAGPGFINLTVTEAALGAAAAAMLADPRLGIPIADPPARVVIDYSAPNVAKEMHVGHIRSTILGDALARVLTHLGHTVTRQNHIGDWGTQFGMLLQHLEESGAADASDVAELNVAYLEAKGRFDADPAFADRSRERVVKLQGGDPDTVARWRRLVDASLAHFETTYARLGVLLEPGDVRGESAYNDRLPEVVKQLLERGELRESDGAAVVYPAGFVGKDGLPLPMIVRKSDGGYLYATTDLAAALHRLETLGAERIVYLSDTRQSQHFAMLFQVLRQAGLARPEVRLDHVPFGSILGADRRPFKTREGGTVRLVDVLDEAEQRAAAVIAAKNPAIEADERARAARVVGIGAIKYADLSSDRIKDYVFDWDRMLALEGNTAPYLLNAYVRTQAIFRRAELAQPERAEAPIAVADEAERALVLLLLDLPQVVASVAESLEPHRLCTHLYEVASAFHRFYERCPVMQAPTAELRASRLALCALVARVLARGLTLLGIGTVERM